MPVARAAPVGLALVLIAALAFRLYAVPIGGRLLVHDEIMVGPPVVNAALVFGMSYENWDFPNYLLALLNGTDGAIGGLLRFLTDDWRTAKLIQYGAGICCVVAGFWLAARMVLALTGTPRSGEQEALVAVVTACYVLSPYALMQMNNGTFWSFSVYFAIAFLPVILLLLFEVATADADVLHVGFGSGLLAGVCAWWLPFAAVLVCSLALAAIFLMLSRPRGRPVNIGFLAGLATGGIPVAITAYFALVEPGYTGDFKLQANATYGIIQGGILTPFLQRFSWILYVGWENRAIHSFFVEFDSLLMRLSYLAGLAALVFSLIIASRRSTAARLLTTLMLVFSSAIFFAKGSSFPFGQIFVSVIESVPGFGVVRTPDTKFGMVATASLALAWIVAGAMNAMVRRALLAIGAVYLVGAVSLFCSGELIDPSGAARYRVTLSPDEVEAIAFVNGARAPGRVLMFPGSGTGTYPFDGYVYVGRNYLTPNINRPVVSGQEGIVGEKHSLQAIRTALEKMDLVAMQEMGIAFVMIDKSREYARYREFVRVTMQGGGARTIVDGPKVALFELTGPGAPFAVEDEASQPVRASLGQFPLFPAGLLVAIDPASAGELRVRADVAASAHWRWLQLGDREPNVFRDFISALVSLIGRDVVGPAGVSRVGLAEWTVPIRGEEAGPTRWLVVHWPNVLLFLTMTSCMVLGIGAFVVHAWRVKRRSSWQLGARRVTDPVLAKQR